MKEKILKAIDKGLMNVLSTDITDQDIDFNHNDIDNDMSGVPVDIDELYAIFMNDESGIFGLYDTKNAISLILSGNKEISLYEYTDGMKPLFLKISNRKLKETGNEILIYIPENHCTEKTVWQLQTTAVLPKEMTIQSKHKNPDFDKEIDANLDGYGNCILLNQYKKTKKLPALQHCMDLHKYGYDGYLPSAGQMKILYRYIKMINYIFEYIGSTAVNINDIKNIYDCIWWTSNECSSEDCAYVINYYGDIIAKKKPYHKYNVLPLFAKKN